MIMDDKITGYLADHQTAAMITHRPDGSVHAVRCGIALVDGLLWSSGTQDRVRTRHLRRDPRCTLFVFGSSAEDPYSYLTLDTTVTILEGDDVPELSWRLFSVMQAGMNPPEGTLYWNGEPLSREQFSQAMINERRLMYQFAVERSYGLY